MQANSEHHRPAGGHPFNAQMTQGVLLCSRDPPRGCSLRLVSFRPHEPNTGSLTLPCMHAARDSQLRALPVEDTRAVDGEPNLVQAAGDGIDLDPQRGDCPGVDDIRGGDQEADQRVGGEHQALIHLQNAQLAGLNVLRTQPSPKRVNICRNPRSSRNTA